MEDVATTSTRQRDAHIGNHSASLLQEHNKCLLLLNAYGEVGDAKCPGGRVVKAFGESRGQHLWWQKHILQVITFISRNRTGNAGRHLQAEPNPTAAGGQNKQKKGGFLFPTFTINVTGFRWRISNLISNPSLVTLHAGFPWLFYCSVNYLPMFLDKVLVNSDTKQTVTPSNTSRRLLRVQESSLNSSSVFYSRLFGGWSYVSPFRPSLSSVVGWKLQQFIVRSLNFAAAQISNMIPLSGSVFT